MKTTIGGDRLGSGSKQEISMKNYERSTHDLSYLWRSSMSSGTLVPFMSKLALPGDTFDIDLFAEVMTLPTIGPLFGSYKVQLDVFEVPMRLYNAKLHMNKLGIGMNMASIYLPQVELWTNNHASYVQTWDDNEQVNPSSLMKYLGVSGLGTITGATDPAKRNFNAIPLLAYWDIYKNYYSNKQETKGWFVHTDSTTTIPGLVPVQAELYTSGMAKIGYCLTGTQTTQTGNVLIITYGKNVPEPDVTTQLTELVAVSKTLNQVFTIFEWIPGDGRRNAQLKCSGMAAGDAAKAFQVIASAPQPKDTSLLFGLKQFDLINIDKVKDRILQYAGATAWIIDNTIELPYSCFVGSTGSGATKKYSIQYNQEGLGIKTFQSDLFNNWISTEWIDGVGGVNDIAKVSTGAGSFTIDALNLAQKVYVMLNRIAISGGTYDDWLDAVYTHERVKGVESPIYHGSLIKELAFEEVISNADAKNAAGETQPLGTLAGRGRLTQKNKGGKMVIKVNEPSYIMGIVSITPRVDYSQGNDWDMNLSTFDNFHKPELSAIGYQDLISEQMLWTDSDLDSATKAVTRRSVGKQPAWINYMTSINKTFGNFADPTKEMFMTLNRRYEKLSNGRIKDATTYIDPTKFNQIFAETNLDAQNFWVQIAANITARRKMSAKVIPNL